jgi:hypothetical protein
VTRAAPLIAAPSAVFASACLPYALPPGELGVGLARDTSADRTLARLSIGVHSASIPRLVDKPLDFGIGYMADLYALKAGETTSKVRTQGFYGEASRFVYRRPWIRGSVGGRAEMLFDDGQLGWGAMARGAIEAYKEAVYLPEAGDLCRIHGGAGAGAFGLYAEAGYERLPGGVQAFASTAGFTFRWPFAYGLIVFICDD